MNDDDRSWEWDLALNYAITKIHSRLQFEVDKKNQRPETKEMFTFPCPALSCPLPSAVTANY